MKVIITGATGAAGLDVLRAALADSSIDKVTVLSRRQLPTTIPMSEKLSTIVDAGFPSSVTFYTTERLAQLRDHSACIWALGKSSVGMNAEEYTNLTVGYPTEALKVFMDAGVKGEDGTFRFVYVSGMGAVTSENGAMWARAKGRAERELTSMAETHNSTHSDHKVDIVNLRPGYFHPSNAQDAQMIRPLWMRVTDKLARPLVRAKFMTEYAIDAQDLGQFAVGAAKRRVEPGVYLNGKMRELLESWKRQ